MYGAFDDGAVLQCNVGTVYGTGYAPVHHNPLGQHVADYRASFDQEKRGALEISVDPAFDLDVTRKYDVAVQCDVGTNNGCKSFVDRRPQSITDTQGQCLPEPTPPVIVVQAVKTGDAAEINLRAWLIFEQAQQRRKGAFLCKNWSLWMVGWCCGRGSACYCVTRGPETEPRGPPDACTGPSQLGPPCAQ